MGFLAYGSCSLFLEVVGIRLLALILGLFGIFFFL